MTYHHEIIERGVCVHACENAISALTEEQADMLYQEIFNDINKMVNKSSTQEVVSLFILICSFSPSDHQIISQHHWRIGSNSREL